MPGANYTFFETCYLCLSLPEFGGPVCFWLWTALDLGVMLALLVPIFRSMWRVTGYWESIDRHYAELVAAGKIDERAIEAHRWVGD